MKIISILNQKGGVGKTTTTINLAKAMVNKGYKVLAIDLDPQANLTSSLGFVPEKLNTILNLLNKDKSIKECIYKKDNLDLIPSNILLSTFDLKFANELSREFLLKNCLKNKLNYDYIFIDNSPSLSLLTYNSLAYTNLILIPVKLDVLSLLGLKILSNRIKMAKNKINTNLQTLGIIGTFYDNTRICKQCFNKLNKYAKGLIFDTYIRQNTALKEAPNFDQDIFQFDNKCHGAIDYINLSNEFLKRIGNY